MWGLVSDPHLLPGLVRTTGVSRRQLNAGKLNKEVTYDVIKRTGEESWVSFGGLKCDKAEKSRLT